MISALLILTSVIVAADGQWAALRQGQICEAATQSINAVYKGRLPGRASVAFDAGGPRHGQFAGLLSRAPRPGAAIILYVGNQPFLLLSRGSMVWSRGPKQEQAIIMAMRANSQMRIEASGADNRRIIDRYSLNGAPLAIDAAAACAAALSTR